MVFVRRCKGKIFSLPVVARLALVTLGSTPFGRSIVRFPAVAYIGAPVGRGNTNPRQRPSTFEPSKRTAVNPKEKKITYLRRQVFNHSYTG